eukprot:COSAG04_NODE_7217_length_1166_cov_1.135895_2_plen_174_part_01
MAAAAPHISALPPHVLQHILLAATTHGNLLRFVATCARVCVEWWRVVGGSSAAYGRGLEAGAERPQVLAAITKAMEREGEGFGLYNKSIDAGAAVVGAALQAMPTIRFTELRLTHNELTVAGVASLAPALRRLWGGNGLRYLDLSGNSGLGDAGVGALAKALPPTLDWLNIFDA